MRDAMAQLFADNGNAELAMRTMTAVAAPTHPLAAGFATESGRRQRQSQHTQHQNPAPAPAPPAPAPTPDRNARKLNLGYETYFFGMVVMKMYQIRSLMFLEKRKTFHVMNPSSSFFLSNIQGAFKKTRRRPLQVGRWITGKPTA